MNKSITGLVGGILMILLGLWLSVQSGQVLFIGLLMFGLLSIVISTVNLAKSRKTVSNGMMIKAMHPEDRPQEMISFLQTLDSQKDLETPKKVEVTCSRRDQICQVNLNGEDVGIVQPDNPVIMNVTKENNVLSISNHYEGICFFHVSDLADTGRIKVGMGVDTSALKVIPGGGIGEGIAIGKALPKEKKKMKKGVKIFLIIIGIIAVALALAFSYGQVKKYQWHAMHDNYIQCVEDCDVEGAREYATKLNLGDLATEDLDTLERFLSYHDSGQYEQALNEYEKLTGWGVSRYGKLYSTYKDCVFETQYKKQAQELLSVQDYAAAVVPLSEFAKVLETGEKQSEYGKSFPENGKLYFDMVEETGNALFASGDNDSLRHFLDDIHWQDPDENYGSHSWADEAMEWWRDNMI